MNFKAIYSQDRNLINQEYNVLKSDISHIKQFMEEEYHNSKPYIDNKLKDALRLKNILEEQLANPNLSYAERYKLNKRLEYCKENIKTWEAKKQEYEEKQKVEKLKKSYAKYLQKQKNNGR